MKNLWQKLVERHRRNKAELDQIELEMALEEASKPKAHLQPFPTRPFKASTIILLGVFGFFVAFAAWACFKELVIPYFR
jgi:hypothetical protein